MVNTRKKAKKTAKNATAQPAVASGSPAATGSPEPVSPDPGSPEKVEPETDCPDPTDNPVNKQTNNRGQSDDEANRKNGLGKGFSSTQRTRSKPLVKPVPVAAIGASAGGLEPIEQFFDAMPVDSGCAFVIIQHLSPDFRSLMDELLARHSTMPIYRITDGMVVEPSSIYLNPPRSVMTLSGNTLKVERISDTDSVYLPIDIFFDSLAEDRGSSALGLILSGTGSDGTRGSKKIESVGGKVLVQDPTTTRFDGMPRSVLAEGYSTLVAAPHVLAESVQRLLKNESLTGLDAGERAPMDDPLSDVLSMLKHSHGTDFLQYKEATIHRRIQRRANMRGLSDINDYRDVLATDNFELQELYADLLIEVTEFFRDQEAFAELQRNVITPLTEDLKDGDSLRVWVPGCASGEEAYSIAIMLQEQARTMGTIFHLKIMATDIHVRSMSQASSGIYTEDALRNMPSDIIERYFDCADGQAQIKPNLRNMVFFSTHDVTRDPPFTRIDLISCRNLLIYLKEDAQQKVMNLLHFSLRKDGFLFLGPSEHIGAISHEFDAINEKWRIFKKRRDVKLLESESIFHRTDLPTGVARVAHPTPRLAKSQSTTYADDAIPFKRAHKAALEEIVSRYAPPGFLLSDDGVVVHIFGNAGELIPLQSGSFSKRIVDLIRPELKVIVTAALDHGRHNDFSGFRRAAYVKESESMATTYEVSLVPMELPGEALRFQLLSIEKAKTVEGDSGTVVTLSKEDLVAIDSSEVLQQRISVLEHSLQSSEESLQSTIEELETSNEELQSTNEELMSTNEELQSTNEELHSVNEELYTVSAEHQRKNEELTERETDIDVLLQSSKIGTIHLDAKLNLRRYTNNARSVFNILPQDVGRPIEHITIRASAQDIPKFIQSANDSRDTHETQVVVDDNVYLLRIMPYRPESDQPSGVLITVIDITDVEQVRGKLAELNVQYRDLIENTDSFFVRWDAKTEKILFCNDAFADRWNSKPERLVGKNIVDLRSAKEQKEFRNVIGKMTPNSADTVTWTSTDVDGEARAIRVFTRAVSRDGRVVDEYQSNGYDVTEELHYRTSLDNLFTAFSDETLDTKQKIEHLLDVGLEYFRLDTALTSMIVGDKYEVKYLKTRKKIVLTAGSTLRVAETICGQFVETESSLAVDNISASKYAGLACHKASRMESYIGAAVHASNGPYGTVNFSSADARGKQFSAQDENLCLFIGSWIGFLLENEEQMEFMARQNEYYQSLFQAVPAMMLLCDPDGLIISASNRICAKFNFKRTTLPGKNCHEMFKVDNPEALKNALTKGESKRQPFTFTLDDGTALDVELNASIKAFGSLQGVRMVVLSDVSDRNRVSRSLEEQNRRLEVANENLNQFAFIASHDLQEPLRKIQQFSSFLEEDLKDSLSEDTNYHLNVIVDASDRMSTLIHDLLRFSGATQEQPESESISLNALAEEVVTALEMQIKESGAKINVGDLPNVTGDKGMLRQLFVNLIGNGIKYRSEKRSLVIKVSAVSDPLKNGVRIADNGIGFEMEFAKRIFEPFNRLHRNNEYKGNGIGLAICSTVCDKHGWKLTAQSELDVGSTFTIDFQQKEKNDSSKKKPGSVDG